MATAEAPTQPNNALPKVTQVLEHFERSVQDLYDPEGTTWLQLTQKLYPIQSIHKLKWLIRMTQLWSERMVEAGIVKSSALLSGYQETEIKPDEYGNLTKPLDLIAGVSVNVLGTSHGHPPFTGEVFMALKRQLIKAVLDDVPFPTSVIGDGLEGARNYRLPAGTPDELLINLRDTSLEDRILKRIWQELKLYVTGNEIEYHYRNGLLRVFVVWKDDTSDHERYRILYRIRHEKPKELELQPGSICKFQVL